jgi:hypothetical protein
MVLGDPWDWFRDAPEPGGVCAGERPSAADKLRALARDRKKCVSALRANPALLFEVVERQSACEHGCCAFGPVSDEGRCTCGRQVADELFLDLLIGFRTLRERDLLRIAGLDWFRLSTQLPLSAAALERHADEVDWRGVSRSPFLYPMDAAFVRAFAERIHWRHVHRADSREVARLLFEQRLGGLGRLEPALSNRLVAPSDLARHRAALLASPRLSELVVEHYPARVADALGLAVPERLRRAVAARCIAEQLVPRSPPLLAALRAACEAADREDDPGSCGWAAFLRALEDAKELDQAFVDAHVVVAGRPVARATWAALSALAAKLSTEFLHEHARDLDVAAVLDSAGLHRAPFDDATVEAHLLGGTRDRQSVCRRTRLSPEIIDRHADTLDWYTLCEFQTLPEWLLRKHLHRLNWGQVSQHQDLSRAFEAEFAARINWVKRAAFHDKRRGRSQALCSSRASRG